MFVTNSGPGTLLKGGRRQRHSDVWCRPASWVGSQSRSHAGPVCVPFWLCFHHVSHCSRHVWHLLWHSTWAIWPCMSAHTTNTTTAISASNGAQTSSSYTCWAIFFLASRGSAIAAFVLAVCIYLSLWSSQPQCHSTTSLIVRLSGSQRADPRLMVEEKAAACLSPLHPTHRTNLFDGVYLPATALSLTPTTLAGQVW